MSPTRMFILGVVTVLASLGVFQWVLPAKALGNGPYMLMQHSNPAANVGVFRVDTSTGGVSYCFITNSNELQCSKEVK